MPFHLSPSPSSSPSPSPSPSPSHPPASPPRLSQSIYSTSKSYSVINPSSIDPLNCLNNNDNDDIPITSPHIIDSLSYPIEQLEYNSILQSATSSISLPSSSHTPAVRLSAIQISSNPPFSGPDSRRSDIFPVKKPIHYRKAPKSELICKDDILRLMHLKLKDAAASLNISESNLKKICRKNGIHHWPARQIISKNRIISTLRQSLKTEANDIERERMLHTIDKLFNDVELIKKNICEGKKRCTSTPISNDMKSSNEPSCVSEFNVESFLKAFEEIEEEEPAEGSGSCIENLHSSMAEKRRNLSNSLFQDTMSRKKRKYSIHLADGVGETVVEVNSESWKNHNNPYLSSTSSEASSFASPSLPSFDLGPNRSALHGQRRLPRRENISTRLLIDQGFIKQDRDNHNKDLYLPFSVILAPLTHYPKLKKHQVIRLMEPDLDITSKSSYRGNPNPYCPSSSLDSTTISPIPSILLPSIVSHEKSIDSRSRT